ncbi:MAG: ABC transporter substrate-binding protein [candidate division NC10 bacterium]|nr:ABC transporter substrate-binding protein [candidate division NC10 bacterium]
MRRRTVLFLAIALVLHSAVTGTAAETILAITSAPAEAYQTALARFKGALRRTGFAGGIEEVGLKPGGVEGERLIQAIRAKRPVLVVTLGSEATARVTPQIKDLPVVFCMALNPVASGFVPELERPGGNVTGASLDVPLSTQFEAIRSVVPAARRVGVLFNPAQTGSVVLQAGKAAQEAGLTLVPRAVQTPAEVPRALEGLGRQTDFLWAVADSTVFFGGSTEHILRYTLTNGIPFMGLSPAFVQAGALMALAVDYGAVGEQCGALALQVLAGRAPAGLAVTVPERVTLHLNLRTAENIGLKIPSQAMKGAVLVR